MGLRGGENGSHCICFGMGAFFYWLWDCKVNSSNQAGHMKMISISKTHTCETLLSSGQQLGIRVISEDARVTWTDYSTRTRSAATSRSKSSDYSKFQALSDVSDISDCLYQRPPEGPTPSCDLHDAYYQVDRVAKLSMPEQHESN